MTQYGQGESSSGNMGSSLPPDRGKGRSEGSAGLANGLSRAALQSGSSHPSGRHAAHALSRRGPSQPVRWLVFVAVAAILSLLTWLVLPHLAPQAGTLLTGGATPEGSLAIGLTNPPATLDIRTRSNPAAERVLFPNVYEGLTARDMHNRPIPALASSWKVSGDKKTYTFHLRSASFSDGSPFSASDVLASFHTATSRKLPGSSLFSPIRSMEAPTSQTIRLHLSSPDPQLLWDLSTAPALITRQGASPSDFSHGILPVGTGPYSAGRLSHGTTSGRANGEPPAATLRLTANTRWWGGLNTASARPATIHVHWYPDSTRLAAALRNGEIGAALDIDPQALTSLDTTKFTTQSGESTAQMIVTFNSAPGSLLSDRLIREAHTRVLATSIARKAYGQDATENPWPIASLDPGYRQTGTNTGDFSPNKFQWLQSAYRRAVTMAVAPDVPQRVVDALGSAEKKAGFLFAAHRLTATQWREQVTSRSADKPMPFDMALWIQHGSHTLGSWMSGINWWDFDSTQADGQYRKAVVAPTEKEYEEGLRQAAGTLQNGHPAAWLLQLKTVNAWKTGLALTGVPSSMSDIYLPLASIRLP